MAKDVLWKPMHIERRFWRWRVRLLFAWYDMWVGMYWDRDWKRAYLLPLPMLGLCIDTAKRDYVWKRYN